MFYPNADQQGTTFCYKFFVKRYKNCPNKPNAMADIMYIILSTSF